MKWLVLLMCFNAFALTSIKGLDLGTQKKIDLSYDEKGIKGTVVAFLSSHCPCSRGQEGLLNTYAQKYAAKGIRFVGINANQDETYEEALGYFQNSKMKFPVIRDQINSLYANELDAQKTPHVFLIDSKGKILYQGGISNHRDPTKADEFYLEKAIESFLDNRPIEKNYFAVLGCFIQRN